MYTLFIPKVEGEDTPFLITSVLSEYAKIRKYQDHIISAPGYMSTTPNTINTFVTLLSNLVAKPSCSPKTKIGVSNGMNGNSHSKILLPGTTISMQMETEIRSSGYFDYLPGDWNNKRDHRKMLFFFTFKEGPATVYSLNKASLEEFLGDIDVNAVMIGSTNQSRGSYFAPIADKGESDIFMFSETLLGESIQSCAEFCANFNDNRGNNYSPDLTRIAINTVLSTSLSMPLGTNNQRMTDNEFFKKILRDFLESSLQ